MAEEHAYTTLTDQNFDQEVLQSPGLVLVDFWAAWCGPCIAMAGHIENLAKKYEGNPNVKITKMNVDEEPQVAGERRILSLPTFQLFANGEAVDMQVGAVPPARLEEMIQRAMSLVKKAA